MTRVSQMLPIPEPNFAVPPPTIPQTDEPPLSPITTGLESGANLEAELEGCSDNALFEKFSNGLGLELETEGRLKSVMETATMRGYFLASKKWAPSYTFTILPYIWLRSKGTQHYYADIVNSVTIVAKEMGFNSPIKYVNCRGWTLNKKGGQVNLEYRKLEQVIKKLAPGGIGGKKLASNFHAMVEHLYDMLDNDALRHIYDSKPFLKFLKKVSFIAKVHSHMQDFQITVILVKAFLMDYIPYNHDNVFYSCKVIFRTCNSRADLLLFVNNMFSLFPMDGGNCELAIDLLTNYRTCMRDQVNCLASNIEHKRRYAAMVDGAINNVKRGTKKNCVPSATRTLLFARACACDLAKGGFFDSKVNHRDTYTLCMKKRKTKSGQKRNMTAGE